ncbi:hypothetical protein [Ornithobacterium rhinotracheale]|uniref:hypothetical protein n=2 Tax=Ornithobacterium rhinotracheale TaxID=28251 RepID=UPI004039D1F4
MTKFETMTPQEKAQELIDAFRNYLQEECEDFGEEILCTNIAIHHAKIVCDEVMKISEDRRITQFYNKVKNELKKMN